MAKTNLGVLGRVCLGGCSGAIRRLHRIVALPSLGISLKERGREYRTMAGFPEDSRRHTIRTPSGLHG